jgi:hypothetical protein
MIEAVLICGLAVALATMYYLQLAHARERVRGMEQLRAATALAASQARDLALSMMTTHVEAQKSFLEDALEIMNQMHRTYTSRVLQAATVVKASSATDAAMAAGTLVQTEVGLDPGLQARFAEIQEKMAAHKPWTPDQAAEDAAAKIQREPPRVIQDPSTGDVLMRM